MTIKEAKIYIRKELSDYYPENEILSFSKIIFEDVFDLSSVDFLLKENKIFSENNLQRLNDIIHRLKQNEPLQYIIGFTEFYGQKFKVSPDVLIPRPETEEIVDLILKENSENKNLHVLDIGTGSGCIAVSLAKNAPSATVFALDISDKALKTAQSNALLNNVNISFIQGDIIKDNPDFSGFENREILVPSKKQAGITSSERQLTTDRATKKQSSFDVIVSNPPYVPFSEKEFMEKNVLDYEPGLALFVEDENPLIFYDAICRFAKQNLCETGKLYFEINEKYGNDIKELMTSFGFKRVDVIKDINRKDRIVRGIIPSRHQN